MLPVSVQMHSRPRRWNIIRQIAATRMQPLYSRCILQALSRMIRHRSIMQWIRTAILTEEARREPILPITVAGRRIWK